MRLANVRDRAVLVTGPDTGVDVATASGGRFGPELPTIYAAWDAFRRWAVTCDLARPDVRFDRTDLGPPSPSPSQIFAIGLNYAEHATETKIAASETFPPVFTKFASALSGPDTTVVLPPGGSVDWENELVVVLGRTARDVERADSWDHVAGLCVGQDLSERRLQMSGAMPQFSLGKSHAGFAPTGPWLVSPDEVRGRDALRLITTLDGETVQDGSTADLLFDVPDLVAGLSRVVELRPGDLIFTGTPSGVGMGRTPRRYIHAGAVLESTIEGLGALHQQFEPREGTS